jgi:hypothetical protein
MLTRKHFEALALIAADIDGVMDRSCAVSALIRLCKADNPAFDPGRFERRVVELRRSTRYGKAAE